MRPNRILRHLPAALLVTLGLLTRESGGVARAEPVLVTSDQPRIVSIAPIGTISRRQTYQLLINKSSGEVVIFGYFNYIHGLDQKQLYLEGSGKPESRALFTLYLEAKITRVNRNGPLLAYEGLGVSTVFYDDTPDGDFSDPETFRDGIPIAMGLEDSVYTFDPETGIGIGDVRLRQFQAWPFEFNGELIQFGAVGNQNVSWRGKTLRNKRFGWTRAFCTSTTVQAEPLPAVPPP
jgi:hypothetical protein